MTPPTKRMLQIGELVYRRHVEASREQISSSIRLSVHFKAWDKPATIAGVLTEKQRAAWAEAALVAFNMGAEAAKLMSHST